VLAVTSLGPDAQGTTVYFTTVEEARFRRPVRPGDTLTLEVVLVRQRLGIWKFEGRARVGDELATECSFSAKVMASRSGPG